MDWKFSTLLQTFSLPFKFIAIDYNLETIEKLLRLLDYEIKTNRH